ncbi:MAG: hypothetical protein CO140_01015 [Candidatus Moranbacteria bacterium CG_4_9_14_3_um_filter_40_7]|nr:MAG: hypothetical protein CO140_01015 [Candidatus Moranbacteria bacterium CG_4_9_14_3_um_filter_40_7]
MSFWCRSRGFLSHNTSQGASKYIQKAINEGVEVIGYNHWSFMDNFEWLYGYEPRFGLIEIDYQTLERKPRKSFYAYREIIKGNLKF